MKQYETLQNRRADLLDHLLKDHDRRFSRSHIPIDELEAIHRVLDELVDERKRLPTMRTDRSGMGEKRARREDGTP